jgi:hypothetical protein
MSLMVSITDERGVVQVFEHDAYLADHPNADLVTCGACGHTWDDAIATAWTPAPSGRCPFEYDHAHDEPRGVRDSYLTSALREQLQRGPQPDEGFFRFKVTGEGETQWLNVSPAQLASIINTLNNDN